MDLTLAYTILSKEIEILLHEIDTQIRRKTHILEFIKQSLEKVERLHDNMQIIHENI